MLLDTSLTEGRDVNRARVAYMAERTVSVRRDCELKEQVTTVTTSRGKIVIATIDAGTPEVQVVIVGKNPSTMLDGRGTGTIIRSYDDASYISTAEHVIGFDDKAKKIGLDKVFDCKITIQLDKDSGGTSNKIPTEVIAKDAPMDLAILKVSKDLKVSSELVSDPFVGEVVWSSGYPRERADAANIHFSVTKGTLATLNVPHLGHMAHRVTSQIFSGNSGGPVWNAEGKLVGTVLFMYGYNNDDGTFTPHEGAYYIRPVNALAVLTLKNQKFSEVFRD
jgi:S1-C subfamily serine protease